MCARWRGARRDGLRDVREMPRDAGYFPDDVELPKLPSFDDVEDAASPCVTRVQGGLV